MIGKKNLDNDFVDKLKLLNTINHNPFQGREIISKSFIYNLTSILGFYEENISQEERCPICLGWTKSATRPSNCNHIFCNFCLKEWNKQSNKCPVCRQKFKRLIKVDISTNSFYSQGNIFV